LGATAAQVAQEKAQADASKNDLVTSMLKSDTSSGLTDELYRDSVDPAKAELSEINNKLVASQHAQRREIEALRKNSQGMFGGALQDKEDEINRKYISEQADLSIIQMAKQGKFADAKEIADRAVVALMDKQRMKNEALKFNYEENKELFDKDERRLFETSQAERDRQLENEEYRLRALFDEKIKQSDPMYQAQLSKARTDAANAANPSLGGTLNGKPQTAGQSTIQGYAQRTSEADKIIERVGSQFTGVGSYVGQTLPNFLKGNDRQQYEQAQRNFVNAVLRRESGAVISDEEFANARQQYFPQPGDKPDVIAQKMENRQTVISNLYQSANVARPIDPGTVIEADGKRYQVGEDGESLIEL